MPTAKMQLHSCATNPDSHSIDILPDLGCESWGISCLFYASSQTEL